MFSHPMLEILPCPALGFENVNSTAFVLRKWDGMAVVGATLPRSAACLPARKRPLGRLLRRSTIRLHNSRRNIAIPILSEKDVTHSARTTASELECLTSRAMPTRHRQFSNC